MRKPLIAAFAATAVVTLTLAATALARRPDQTTAPAIEASQAPEQALDDATIVAIFDAANTADIETGQLAAERGTSKEVRDFGAMLARDHKMVRQLGRDLATKLSVTPTPPADDPGAKAHADAMTSLRAKRGAEFDLAFARREVAFHKAVLDAINSTLLPAIKNPELKALVVKVGPAFEAHMIAAQNLEKTLATRAAK
jgi:putative membrane protein